MNRGDLVVVSAPGDFGKPRPAVVVQIDLMNQVHDSIVVCLLTSYLLDAPDFRLTIEPTPGNGLRSRSQIMIDKVMAIKRDRFGSKVGVLSNGDMQRVERALSLLIGLGG